METVHPGHVAHTPDTRAPMSALHVDTPSLPTFAALPQLPLSYSNGYSVLNRFLPLEGPLPEVHHFPKHFVCIISFNSFGSLVEESIISVYPFCA